MENAKVNKEEIKKLIEAMIESKERVAETIKDYTKAVQKLVDAGQIQGAFLDTFDASLAQMLKVSREYDYYCDDMIPTMVKITESE